jgi:hypothetical protein
MLCHAWSRETAKLQPNHHPHAWTISDVPRLVSAFNLNHYSDHICIDPVLTPSQTLLCLSSAHNLSTIIQQVFSNTTMSTLKNYLQDGLNDDSVNQASNNIPPCEDDSSLVLNYPGQSFSNDAWDDLAFNNMAPTNAYVAQLHLTTT